MTKIFLKIILFINILFFCVKSNAQKSDFIVTYSKDTIYGDKIWESGNTVKVKKNRKKTKFPLDDVKIRYDSKDNSYYEKITNPFHFITEDKIFMERLTNGKIELFFYYLGDGGFGNPTICYYLRKNNLEKRLSYNRRFSKKVFKEISTFVKDDKEIVSELNSIKKLKRKIIIELINKYNQNFNDKK